MTIDKIETTPPRAFVSYSWSTPEHEAWVVDLASQLRTSGVDVILDKWDLREGDDAVQFMERMVTDQTVTKVIMICDRAYVEKTDKRTGGVGTEAQIISSKIYEAQKQTKFAAVVTELDDKGKPYVPAYYKSRIYIDMTDGAAYSDRFEQLLRWIFDKPVYERPPLGEPPAFLASGHSPVFSSTTPLQRRALDALTNGKPYAHAAVEEYLGKLVREMGTLRIAADANPFDEVVVESVGAFLPTRNELIDLLMSLYRYSADDEITKAITRFLEDMLPLMFRPEGVQSWHEQDWDNLRFLVHEVFLYVIAAGIKVQKFGAVTDILSAGFYFEKGNDYGEGKLTGYQVFYHALPSLEARAERLGKGTGSRRISIHADLLKERAVGIPLSFADVMQADFVLYLRSLTLDGYQWWPVTSLYAKRDGPFEIFARAVSASYFERLKSLLNVDSAKALQEIVESVAASNRAPRWDYSAISLPRLTGISNIATKP